MSVLKRIGERISGTFRPITPQPMPVATVPAPAPPAAPSQPPAKLSQTHREKLASRDDDITAQFALAFQALHGTAVRGASAITEMHSTLLDESEKLKNKLKES